MQPVATSDGTEVGLTHHAGGDKGPIVLAPGYGNAARAFALDTVPKSFADHLAEHGYDVWLFDYRASPDLPSSRTQFNVDDIAMRDWPAAIAEVRAGRRLPPGPPHAAAGTGRLDRGLREPERAVAADAARGGDPDRGDRADRHDHARRAARQAGRLAGARHAVPARDGHPPEAVAYAKEICRYLVETYGRFPAHTDAFHLPGIWVQFSHLGVEYYERFAAPGFARRAADGREIWGR